MIIADTGAVLALIDAGDRHHRALRALYEEDPNAWLLPSAILPEVDNLVARHLGAATERLFVDDLAAGRWHVDWRGESDLGRIAELNERYADLELGLVDAAVIAVAERRRARAIATLDVRHFGAVEIDGSPLLVPRDL